MIFELFLPLEFLLAEGTLKSLLITVHFHVSHQGILSHELIATHLKVEMKGHPFQIIPHINALKQKKNCKGH